MILAHTDSLRWLRDLARPYLRGYRPKPAKSKALRGFWFVVRTSSLKARGDAAGFFVGYLTDAAEWAFLNPEPPECLVFAFVQPLGGRTHERLVVGEQALLRRTFTYIRWLTHRPPRFQFFANQLPALVRRRSMRDWPAAKHQHFSRNFFIETLAWLVRSGLVRKLAEEAGALRATTRSRVGARTRVAKRERKPRRPG